ncbi:MAG: hypothetical protein QOD39_2983 [Mycobacterium sp.]|nr:hypothetical protein [Mycobacterium sp.]
MIASTSPRRLASAAFLVAGALALGFAPASHALPPPPAQPTAGEWDIGAYDDCVSHIGGWETTNMQQYYVEVKKCCFQSGGQWSPRDGGNSLGSGDCVAPPASAASHPRRIPGGADTTNVPTTHVS